MLNILYAIVALLVVAGTGFLSFVCMKKYNGNMGSNIGRANNKRWGLDEGQERDWY